MEYEKSDFCENPANDIFRIFFVDLESAGFIVITWASILHLFVSGRWLSSLNIEIRVSHDDGVTPYAVVSFEKSLAMFFRFLIFYYHSTVIMTAANLQGTRIRMEPINN